MVRVRAPARLHLGFLDLNGSAGRKFGSIGLAIDTHHTVVEAQRTHTTSINNITTDSAATSQKANNIIDTFYTTLGQHIAVDQRGVTLTFLELIPEHAGLGSGTQLALTIGTALCRLHQISASTHDIAAQLGRGSRSGIGIATFDHGGFIIDGGLSDASPVPPLLAHYDFPENWYAILIVDKSQQGVHGTKELNAFKDLPTYPIAHSHAICHITLMKLLPALVEHQLTQFGQAIADIQMLIGDHFAPAQGGRYSSPHVASLLHYAQNTGHSGIAQTSWGPTGVIFVEGHQAAEQLIAALNQHAHDQFSDPSNLSFTIAQSNQSGANIEIING